MRRGMFILATAIAANTTAAAQARPDSSLAGDWSGTLNAGGQSFRLVLHVTRSGDSLAATIDSPDQGAHGITARIQTRLDSLFVIVGQAFSLEGVRDRDTLRLAFVQGGARLPVTLGRGAASRPPYEEREVVAAGGAPRVRLAGTLSVPPKALGPAILLIAGSGPLTRDAVVAGHRQFAVLADSLARAGFVVLRYDKRGVGRSTGNYEAATTTDFTADAAAMLAELRRVAPDSNRVFVVGHSEGALIAARLAAAKLVAGVVLLAAPAHRGDSLMILRSRLLSAAAGASSAVVSREAALRAAILRAAVAARDSADARRTMTIQLDDGLAALPAADRALPGFARAAWMALVEVIAPQWLWFRDWLITDPLPAYRAVRVPVLAIAGEKDQQVPPSLTVDRLRRALGNDAVVVMPGLNHLMQTAISGSPAEYASLREAMSPGAIAAVAAWIARPN